MNEIGVETSGNTKLWYDEEYFYINKDEVKEILELEKCQITFYPKLRKALSDKCVLITNQRYNKVSKKDTFEYCLHITKPLYGEHYSKVRYYTFSIQECRKNGLFPKLVSFYTRKKVTEAVERINNENKV